MPDSLSKNTQNVGTEALRNILVDLHIDIKDLSGSLIISRDGLTMAAYGVRNDADSAGAVCTELYGRGRALAAELQRGELCEVLLKTKDGYVMVIDAGEHAYLALLAREDANLGLVFLELRRTAQAVANSIAENG